MSIHYLRKPLLQFTFALHIESQIKLIAMVSPVGSTVSSNGAEMYADIDWEKLGFGLITTDYIYIMKCPSKGKFTGGEIREFDNMEMSPASGVLNYGQGLFEGLKAYRKSDGGIQLFRPELNALRMQMGAKRLCMPAPSVEQFVDAAKQIVIANKRWVPPHGKGSLYLRPLLMGSGAVLGIGPAPEYTFLIFASPIGNYYKGKESLKLFVEENIHRTHPGGTGGIKAIANYSGVYEAVAQAKEKGFSDVLFLDATGKYIEEVSSCNIFIVKNYVISTPSTHDTILPGITRNSIIQLAIDMGFKATEKDISIEEFMNADEVFCTGTAMVVTPVASVTYKEKRVDYVFGEGSVAHKLHLELTGIQYGIIEDKMGWTVQVD